MQLQRPVDFVIIIGEIASGVGDMGMDSRKLSARSKQPGHDRTFVKSEVNFIDVARQSIGSGYEVVKNPKELRSIFGGAAESALAVCRISYCVEIGETAVHDAFHSIQPRSGVPAAA